MFNLAKIYTYIYIKIKVKTLLRIFLSPYIHITYFYGTLSLYIPNSCMKIPKELPGLFYHRPVTSVLLKQWRSKTYVKRLVLF